MSQWDFVHGSENTARTALFKPLYRNVRFPILKESLVEKLIFLVKKLIFFCRNVDMYIDSPLYYRNRSA